jgi:hypothetical protein
MVAMLRFNRSKATMLQLGGGAGGLAFLLGGNMAVCVSGQGGILVRIDPGTAYARALPAKR